MIVTLTEGVLKAMFVSKLKSTALAITALTITITGAGVLAQQPTPPPGDQAAQLRSLEQRLDRVIQALEATTIKRVTGEEATPKKEANVDAHVEERLTKYVDRQKQLSNKPSFRQQYLSYLRGGWSRQITSEDPKEFLRQISLDIRGIAPSSEELDEFVKDHSPEAIDKVLERYMKSPEFEKTSRDKLRPEFQRQYDRALKELPDRLVALEQRLERVERKLSQFAERLNRLENPGAPQPGNSPAGLQKF